MDSGSTARPVRVSPTAFLVQALAGARLDGLSARWLSRRALRMGFWGSLSRWVFVGTIVPLVTTSEMLALRRWLAVAYYSKQEKPGRGPAEVCDPPEEERSLLLAVLPPVHPALVDDQSNEVPVSSTLPQLPYAAAVDVRPGDHDAATATEAWLQAYATSRDPVLRERITLAYLGLADRLAGRYRHSRGTTPEDLIQTARAGLIAAIDRYDPDYGTRFVAYAVACVVGELKRHLRDASWRLHVPRPLKERALRLYRTADELHQRWGRFPTTRELAEQLEVGEEEVLEALAALSSRQEVSLDQPVGDADLHLGDLLAAPGAGEEPEDLMALSGLLAALPELERKVMVLRFFHDLDQDEIAARVGFSQMHVSRLQRRALARMRAQLVEA
jgi:RNA polymerase sigma-B factor